MAKYRKENSMTDKDKEKLHQILSSLWKNDDSVGKMYYNQALQDAQIAIDSLQEEPVSEQKLSNVQRIEKNWKESVSEELEELIDKLSTQFPEVSFAKLSRIAVRVAKRQLWQINEVLLSEVLPCFMHGGEADEVVAKLDEVLNQK